MFREPSRGYRDSVITLINFKAFTILRLFGTIEFAAPDNFQMKSKRAYLNRYNGAQVVHQRIHCIVFNAEQGNRYCKSLLFERAGAAADKT